MMILHWHINVLDHRASWFERPLIKEEILRKIVNCQGISKDIVDRSARFILNSCWKIYCTVVPPYPRVMRSKANRGYLKPRIIPNAIYI